MISSTDLEIDCPFEENKEDLGKKKQKKKQLGCRLCEYCYFSIYRGLWLV